MWVLVDDRRDMNVDVIVRNVDTAIDCLYRLNGLIEVLLIDFDLGNPEDEPVYDIGIHKRKPKRVDSRGRRKPADGYDVLMYAIINNLLPPVVQVVSDNPAGRKKLESALKFDAKYIKQGNNWIQPEEPVTEDEGDQNDESEQV